MMMIPGEQEAQNQIEGKSRVCQGKCIVIVHKCKTNKRYCGTIFIILPYNFILFKNVRFCVETRLSSIESQTKKGVVFVVVLVVLVVGLVVVCVVAIIIVGHRNLTLKFGQNQVNKK